MEEVKPTQIFSPSALDRHPDHRMVASALRAVMAQRGAEVEVYEYPIWFSIREVFYRFFHPQSFCCLRSVKTGVHLPWKKRAFLAHVSQADGAMTPEDLTGGIWDRYFGPFEVFYQIKNNKKR